MEQVLDQFERSRSSGLGGPETLERCQREGNLFVVGRVDQCRFFSPGVGAPAMSSVVAVLGDRLQIRTRLQIKARGVALVFHHELWRKRRASRPRYGLGAVAGVMSSSGGSEGSNAHGLDGEMCEEFEMVMKGVVTIYSIKEATKEPSPIPDWLLRQTHSFVVSKG